MAMERDMTKRNEIVLAGGAIRLQVRHENGRAVLYCVVNGKRIAKRYHGQPWINLDPSYTVRGGERGNNDLLIERKGT
jgi:hypothetical protein